MECRDIQTLLADYDSGAIDRKRSAFIQSHLAECPICCAELQAIRMAGFAVESLEEVEPPIGIWQMIEARGGAFFTQPGKRQSWFGTLRLEWAAASAVMAILLFILSVVISLHSFQPRPPAELLNPTTPAPIVQPIAANAPMIRYFDQHEATSARDELADPVSSGLVTFISDTMPVEESGQ